MECFDEVHQAGGKVESFISYCGGEFDFLTWTISDFTFRSFCWRQFSIQGIYSEYDPMIYQYLEFKLKKNKSTSDAMEYHMFVALCQAHVDEFM